MPDTPETERKQTVTLIYDRDNGVRLDEPKQVVISVTDDLAGVFARAANVNHSDTMDLSFTSLLAGLVTGDDPVSHWLKQELAQQRADLKKFAADRKRPFDEASLSSIRTLSSNPKLKTSESARKAIETSKAIATALGNATVIDIRHLVAAYPTIPDWHEKDFDTLGVNRLAWCRRFAERMAASFPSEKSYWRKYADRAAPVPLTSFNADVYSEKDLLGVDRSVDALALLIASTRTGTPLSIGVFGPWGSGKSFFMSHLRKRLWGLAGREQARVSEWVRKREEGTAKEADTPLYYGQIAQVEFNAWHYNEGNLVASLVDHLFRNLRVLPGRADKELEERRAQVLLQMSDVKIELTEAAGALERTREQVASAQEQVQAAGQQVDAARRDVDAKREELETTTSEAAAARKEVDDAMTRLMEEAKSVNVDAAAAVVLRPLLDSPVVRDIKKAAADFTDAIADWRKWIARLWSPRGLVVILILVAVPIVVRLTNEVAAAWTTFAGAATALGTATAEIRSFIRTRRKQFDTMFENLEREEARRLQEQRDALEQQKKDVESEWNQKLGVLRNEIAARQTAVQEREEALAAAGRALAEETKALEQKVEAKTSAEEAHRELQARLQRLSSALLLDEFIAERSGTDEYRKQLGFLALVRRDFERLSDLIASANGEWLSPTSTAKPPLLNRIVLYIDDLDRCSPQTVVKVLEVVHLLLAFKLFVCVVAVDPRWIEKCLREKHQFGLGAAENDSAHLTVGDYLEKIFQIPIWMNPIEPNERSSVVRALLGPIATEETRATGEEGDTPAAVAHPTPATARVDSFQAAIHKAEEVPDPLQITEKESLFLDQVSGLLSDKPRALIRFVNTYRLLKATLPHIDRQAFVSDAEDSPYKICMSQLAFFTGYPRLAPLFVQQLRDRGSEKDSLISWFRALPDDMQESFGEAFRHLPLKTTSVKTLMAWLPDTSRYLFHREV